MEIVAFEVSVFLRTNFIKLFLVSIILRYYHVGHCELVAMTLRIVPLSILLVYLCQIVPSGLRFYIYWVSNNLNKPETLKFTGIS